MRYFLSLLALSLTSLWALALPQGFYARRSVLGQGDWVKVAVEETGVYEISYETLRGMGFNQPEKVGVFGRGGAQLSENFKTLGGSINIKDDLSPVAVLHFNNKLYFYGVGTQSNYFRSSSAYDCKGYFCRQSKNIYSERGFYFLTDKESPLYMQLNVPGDTSTLTEVSSGIGKVAHEVDLVQNNSNTGQLFFGEKAGGDTPRLRWDVTLPGLIPGLRGAMECYFYVDRDITGHLSYGIEGMDDYASFDTKTFATTNFRAQEPYVIQTYFPSEESTVFLEFNSDSDCDISHLDYWTLTYPRTIPTLKDAKGNKLNQEYIYLPTVTRGKSVAVTFPEAASLVVLDVTSPTTPKQLDFQLKGSRGTVKVTNEVGYPELVAFDPNRPQLQISGFDGGFASITNQDIHAQLADGADMLIITIESLRAEAEKLAQAHRDIEGIKVVVATAQEIYNEFTQGIPDAMAYRSAVKMAYETQNPIKNLLLLGPITADFRGINLEKNPYEVLIAYQSQPMNQLRGAQNANDFYGMMDDYLEDSNLEKNTMHVGVGVLPCRFPEEVATVTEKVKNYLSRTDFAYYANRMMNVGGIGDNHTHDKQALTICTNINQLENRSTIVTPLIVDAYGYRAANEKFFRAVEDGCSFINYFGHGDPYLLNHEGDFFRIHHVYKLRNTFLPFWGFAGCELSNSDRGIRGLGEALVTSTPYGMIGTLLATRETWSGQNMEMFKSFMTNLFRNGNTAEKPVHFKPLTIGEVFARTKTASSYNNELAYQLMCDPAIRIPIVTRDIMLDEENYDGVVGDFTTISGHVCDYDGQLDETFNGEIVIRLMEPFQQLTSQDIISSSDPNTTSKVEILYADTQTAITVTNVENGKFSARLFIPASAKSFNNIMGRLHLCAYEPTQRLTAGTMVPMTYKVSESPVASDYDTSAPTIEAFEYIQADNAIYVKISDDLALSFCQSPLTNCFKITIDGREYSTASRQEAIVEEDGAASSKLIPLSDLSEGIHTAMLSVSDASGNETQAELVFNYSTSLSRYQLQLNEGVIAGKGGTFTINGNYPTTSEIRIIDSNGKIVYLWHFTGSEFEWDGKGGDGQPLPPGLYKAYVIEMSDSLFKGHSNTIEVPVI